MLLVEKAPFPATRSLHGAVRARDAPTVRSSLFSARLHQLGYGLHQLLGGLLLALLSRKGSTERSAGRVPHRSDRRRSVGIRSPGASVPELLREPFELGTP